MQSMIVSWILPDKREKGGALPIEEIDHVTIELSADLGANYASIGDFGPTILETLLQDLENGEWFVRGTVYDTTGQASKPLEKSFLVADTSPPGGLVSLDFRVA